MVKTPQGELTGAELRKLIRGHNVLVSIKIPKGTDRDGLIKLIEGKGYKIDHKKKAIIDAKKDRPRRPKVTLEKAKELTKPKPKTELQKQKSAEAKKEKEQKKKKEVRAIKKEAIQQQKDIKKKVMKKEDEVRPKEKVGRPKFDPKKIKVIEPKKKEEPKKKVEDEFDKEETKNKRRTKQLDEKIIPKLLNKITEKYKFFDITHKDSKKYRKTLTEKRFKKDKEAFYKDFNKFDKLVDESEDKGGDAVFRNEMIITPDGKWEKKYMFKINTINEMIGNIETYEKELKKK